MRIWLTVPLAFIALGTGCKKDNPKPSAAKDYPDIIFTEERPFAGNEKWYACWGETKDGLAFVMFEHGTPPGGHRISSKSNSQGKNEGWLLKPDGTKVQLPTNAQLHEVINGAYRERDGRVTAEQLKAFLASRPKQYTVDALLGFVKHGSEPESQPSTGPAKRSQIYDEKADARADIAKVLTRARQANKRVLIVYGGNWCSWCYRFHDLLTKDPEISREIERSYEVVYVEARLNPGIGEGYGIEEKKGFPYLTVLNADNKVIRNQETGVFEQRGGYKPAAVRDFFLKYRPDPKSREETSQGSTAAPRS
jgi:hypothetical protein